MGSITTLIRGSHLPISDHILTSSNCQATSQYHLSLFKSKITPSVPSSWPVTVRPESVPWRSFSTRWLEACAQSEEKGPKLPRMCPDHQLPTKSPDENEFLNVEPPRVSLLTCPGFACVEISSPQRLLMRLVYPRTAPWAHTHVPADIQ